MLRKIIRINEDLCNGCGLCVNACHEGAIKLVDGKARLWREDYCDGLGDCLPACPVGAISFETREAKEYNESAVKENMEKEKALKNTTLPCGCPSTHTKSFNRENTEVQSTCTTVESHDKESKLSQWPVQIKLVPTNAPYFKNANLLIAADCCAYAHGDFHNRFMKNKITLIGCPKLDMIDYTEKLCEIIRVNDIQSVTVVKMEVPCCKGIEIATTNALKASGKFIPWQIVTITTDGREL